METPPDAHEPRLSSLEHSHQQLLAAQERIAQLEAQLSTMAGTAPPDTVTSRYAPLFDDLLEGCQIISPDWRYVYINHAAARFGGQIKEEMIGHTIEERFPGFSESDVHRLLHRCMTERRSEDAEIPFTFPDGRVAWFAFRVQPCSEGVFILTQDITERKRSEEALRSSEERYRRVIETVEDYAIFSMDLDGRITSWNLGAEKITGYASSEVIGRHYAIFFSPEDVLSGTAQSSFRAAQRHGHSETEGWRVRKDGSRFWINGAVTAVTNGSGEVIGYSAIVRDSTDRRRNEEQIHKLNRILAVLSDVNQAIVRVRDLRALFQLVCQIAVEKGDYSAVWIGEVTGYGGRIVPAASAGIAVEALEELDLNSGDAESHYSPTAAAARTGERVIVSDDTTDGPTLVRWQEEIRRLGYRAEAAFPLKVSGRVHAVLTLYASTAAVFDEAEVRLLDEMAGDIAFAMEFAEGEAQRQQGERSLQRYAQRLEILHNIDVGIINAQSIQSIVETTVWNLRQMIPCQQVRVTLFNEALTEATVFAVDTSSPSVVRVGARHPISPEHVEAFGSRSVRIIDDLQDHPELHSEYQPLIDEGIRSMLNALLMIQGRPGGVISLNASTPGFFTAEDREIAAQVANQIAIAIRQMQLADALKQHAAELAQRVTERTADLQVAKEQVEAILNNSLEGVTFLDARLRIVQANTAFTALLGYDYIDPYQIAFADLVESGDRAAFLGAVAAVTTHQTGADHGQFIEVRMVGQSGAILDVEIGIGSIPGSGVVCTVHDMTARKASERQLRANARVQDNMSDAVLVTDDRFIIQSWNRAAERIYGWRAEEVVGKQAPEILGTVYASQEERQRIVGLLRDQGWWQGEVTQHHRDGSTRHILASATWLKELPGVPASVVSVNHDITERKQAEEALRKYAAEVADLYNNAPCGYHSLASDGLILQMNDTELRWLGYPREEVVGKRRMSDFLTPDSVAKFRATFPGFVAQGTINDIELELVRRDGSVFPVLVNGSAIYDVAGQYVMSRSTVFDITALKQAQAALVESEQRYRLLAENVSDEIVRLTTDGVRTYVSPSSFALLGYDPETLLGQSIFDIVHEEDLETVRAAFQEAVEGVRPTFRLTRRLRHQGGHYVWVEGTYSVIRDQQSGKALEIVGVVRDVTERKRAEDALVQALEKEKELGELKTRFVSMASHEFRTPLAGILSSTEMIINYRQKMREEEIVNRLENVRSQVQHMTGIMEDVLQLGRIQSGRIEFNPVEIDLDKLCREVIAEFIRTPETETRIEYNCPAPPVRAHVDARLMRQSLTNLISNALKYSPPEKPVHIDLLTDSQVVTFRIRDEGIGIPEKDLPHLFEPFRRASNVGAVSGTGLGLSITQQAIEQHGGSIAVESEVGVGTMFTVHLPAAG